MKATTLYTDTIKDLRHCYDTHAKKFSSTRKKNRPEVDYVIQLLLRQKEEVWKPLTIIEIGCGDWRLFWYIHEKYPALLQQYIGVDISMELLSIAQERYTTHSEATRVHDDMIHYLSSQKNQSTDCIICLASFQHLPDKESRSLFLHNIYRVLSYWGAFISIDRSWSKRMLQKHWKLLIDSLRKRVLSLWKRERNNLLIPFSNQWENAIFRLYHIFTKYELKRLLYHHGLNNHHIIYSSQDGKFHNNILNARNICTHARKDIFSSQKA